MTDRDDLKERLDALEKQTDQVETFELDEETREFYQDCLRETKEHLPADEWEHIEEQLANYESRVEAADNPEEVEMTAEETRAWAEVLDGYPKT